MHSSLVVFFLISFAANIIAAPLEPLRKLVHFLSPPFCQVLPEVPTLLAFSLSAIFLQQEIFSRALR